MRSTVLAPYALTGSDVLLPGILLLSAANELPVVIEVSEPYTQSQVVDPDGFDWEYMLTLQEGSPFLRGGHIDLVGLMLHLYRARIQCAARVLPSPPPHPRSCQPRAACPRARLAAANGLRSRTASTNTRCSCPESSAADQTSESTSTHRARKPCGASRRGWRSTSQRWHRRRFSLR